MACNDAMQRALRTPLYQAGKGSADRSHRPTYRENFDTIRWSPKEKDKHGCPKPKKTFKKYRL